MKKLFIILGNGFTIDFLTYYNKYCLSRNKRRPDINVTNLMVNGEKIIIPWDEKPGFLSYKNCPALWTLGARPYQSIEDSNSLIEEIISCANMFFDFIHDKEQRQQRVSMRNDIDEKIYLKAYCELVAYLQQLFSYYNSEIDDDELEDFLSGCDEWGWKNLIDNSTIDKYEEIAIVTYNYDVWLERLFMLKKIPFTVEGINNTDEKVKIIKPHGSISFVPNDCDNTSGIKYNLNLEGGFDLDAFHLEYKGLNDYVDGAIIPPAGDSMRLETSTSWARLIRGKAIEAARRVAVSEKNDVILCGISYWYVDRHEIDELLVNLNHKANLFFINPTPPRDLNAVLSSIFQNYVLLTSSNNIGGLLNG